MHPLVRHLRTLVDAHGWAVQHVTASDRERPFAYTIGLTEAGARELLVVGLPVGVADALLNDVAGAMRSGTLAVRGGTEIRGGDLAGDFSPFTFRVVEVDRLYVSDRYVLFNLARLVLDRPMRGADQIVWPDEEGRYPGDPAYDEVGCPQPVFDRPGVAGYRNTVGP